MDNSQTPPSLFLFQLFAATHYGVDNLFAEIGDYNSPVLKRIVIAERLNLFHFAVRGTVKRKTSRSGGSAVLASSMICS
jgi:hypothetical protein